MNRVHSEVRAKTSYMAAWISKAINEKCSIEEINKSYQRIKLLLDNLLMENPGSITAFE
ncbi:5103_t:CDS:1, partial [Gigaspora margarita]